MLWIQITSQQAYVRGALTVSQSETDKAKPTSLKSVLTFFQASVQFKLCVHIIKTSLHFPLRVCNTF